jgi:2OG-Fe(II) oxygenase superfamily
MCSNEENRIVPERFHWTTFDVRSLLVPDWQAQILSVAQRFASRKILITKHSTSREARNDDQLPTQTVDGVILATHLPWLRLLYENQFRELAQLTTAETVSIMSDPSFALALNVQSGSDRYECHVDTNPIEGLLYVTTHREGEGGELVISNRGQAHSVEEVDEDASVLEPKAGYLVFFDGRNHSHYVTSLKNSTELRVVVGMNYYVPSWPESRRPADLNRHLSGYANR